MEPTQLRSAGSREGILGILAHWAFLYAFWVVLSGMFDPFHLGAGLLATGLVAVLTHELQYFEHGSGGRLNLALALAPWHRHLRYALWLWWEIVKANVQVARIVLHPKLPIRPAMIPYRTLLRSDLGKTLLANSITLTPGTVTVLVEEQELWIHALVEDESTMATIAAMEQGIARALPGIEPVRRESP